MINLLSLTAISPPIFTSQRYRLKNVKKYSAFVKKVILWHKKRRYDASLEKTVYIKFYRLKENKSPKLVEILGEWHKTS